jgi:uncharacterized protein YceK
MRTVILISLALCCTGCGTLISTYFGGLKPYGGVRFDVENIAEATTEKQCWLTDDNPPMLDRYAALQALSLVALVCDTPFSAIADTCALPFYLMGYRRVLGWM